MAEVKTIPLGTVQYGTGLRKTVPNGTVPNGITQQALPWPNQP